MFKFVAVSLVALSLAACGAKEEEVAPAAEAAPAVEAAPAADAAVVPAEGVSATAELTAEPVEPKAE